MPFNYHRYGSYIGSDLALLDKAGKFDIVTGQLVGDSLFQFTSFTFTNAGATGVNGPSLTTLRNTYNTTTYPWINDSSFFDQGEYQGFQKFTIPKAGEYRITAKGGGGGQKSHLSYRSGTWRPFGAQVVATYTFDKGDQIQIIVGQKGEDDNTYFATQNSASEGDNAAPGGGGASYVFFATSDTNPIVVAGGGAGGTKNTHTDSNASLTTSGNSSQQSTANGGSNGQGGGSNAGGSSYWAGAGAGWLSNGTGGNQGTVYNYLGGTNGAQGGRSPANGALGGEKHNDGTNSGGDGGFGGGAGGGSDNMGTGGGGGYSGGGGGNSSIANSGGGGGGSYSNATNRVGSAAITLLSSNDHGSVLIEKL